MKGFHIIEIKGTDVLTVVRIINSFLLFIVVIDF